MKNTEAIPPAENDRAQQFEPKSATVTAAAVPQSLLALIAQQQFFKGLSPRHLEQLSETALLMQFETGQQIFREGDAANRFFIILKGKVALECDGEDETRFTIQTLGQGDDLGWSWLFQPFHLHFSARAVEPTNAIFFYAARLRQQCEADNVLGYELMKRIAQVVVRRLDATQRRLSEFSSEKRYRD